MTRYNLLDISRINLINNMSQAQKDMFLIGMCYHSAYMTSSELASGRKINSVDLQELQNVKVALKRQKLNSDILEVENTTYDE